MQSYELVLVLRPTLSEAERKKVLESIKAILHEVTISEENDWGSKALEYPIQHESTGYYVDFILQSEKGLPVDLDKRLIGNTNILRHLLIRKK